VKSFISAQENSYRPPYGRSVVRQPRHFVIVGSTNDEQYLTDPSGARRFWPVVVKRTLDVEWVRKNRDQLFAEAVHAHASGESWWFDVQPEALVEAQEARYVHDIIDDKVGAFIEECDEKPFTLAQLVERNGWAMDRAMAMRLADVLKKRGFKKRKVMFEGERSWRWAKPEWEMKKLGLDLDDIM
jgi:predicted P-loop ATPase